jgi:Na+-translocating ferredoxin:NAD+ oxidoreductase RNF subunit RnfB
MQCQICVEVCPFDAIKMDNNYEKSQYGRFDELVEHLPELLKSNEFYNKIKPTEAIAVDAKLKADAEKKAKKAAPAAAKPAAAPKPAAPAAPKPAPAAAPMAKIAIPDDAPFTPEQRQWLSGYLSTVGVSGVAPAAAAPVAGTPAATAPAAEAPAGNWPWHDPALGMQQRLDLAKDTSIADKLMAAMAQTDCHACGYDCRGYADAIATGAETDLSLCLPGEAETANVLKKLMQEAGKL